MKHLKTFEQHSIEETNEFWGAARKFATGHESGEAKNAKKSEIEAQIEDFLTRATEAGWAPEKIEKRRMLLLKAAADDNWRGNIKNGQYQVMWSDLQAIGANAAAAHRGYGPPSRPLDNRQDNSDKINNRKQKLLSDIDNALASEVMNKWNPEQKEIWKEKMIKAAEKNNWKGSVEVWKTSLVYNEG